MEGSGRALIKVLSQTLPEELHSNFSQDSQCPNRDSNTASPKHEFNVTIMPTVS
jgi:hypothetical protein